MLEQWIGWSVAAGAAILCLAVGWRLRAEIGRAASLARERDALREELAAARKQSGRKTSADKRRSEELAELRKKLEKARRRAGQARDEQQGEAARIKRLEHELALREADLRQARSEIERLGEAPPAREAPAPPPSPPAADPAALEAAERRLEQSGARVRELERERDEALREAERQRERARTQDKLYTALRGELDAKKDRLRTQQEELERLRALKVVVVDPPPDVAPGPSEETE